MLIRKCFSIATVTAGLLLVGSANVQAIEIVVPGGQNLVQRNPAMVTRELSLYSTAAGLCRARRNRRDR